MPPDPSIVLLLGEPVTRSLSPGMQNVAFAALGIDCQYMPREVDRAGLAGVIDELRADEHILGANVTIPHKESVIAYLDELDPQAVRSRRSGEGRAMLLYQGAAAFEIWTGRPAPIEAMRAALERAAEGVHA